MPIFLPGTVAESILAESRGRKEAKHLIAFKKRLRALDSRFGIFLQDTDHPDLKRGYYYAFRRSDDGRAPVLWEISGPDGEFCEPSEMHLEALRKVDASRTNQRAEREAQRRRKERDKEHRKEFDAEERQEKMKELLEHRLRLQMRPGRDV